MSLKTPTHARYGARRRGASHHSVVRTTAPWDTVRDRADRFDPARHCNRSLDGVRDRLAPHPAPTRQPLPRQDVHVGAPQAPEPPQTSMSVSPHAASRVGPPVRPREPWPWQRRTAPRAAALAAMAASTALHSRMHLFTSPLFGSRRRSTASCHQRWPRCALPGL